MIYRYFPIVFLLAVLTPKLSFANTINTGIQTEIEPIFGYEQVQETVPVAHTTDRLVYGARASVGIPAIALETEYLYGKDTETFSSSVQSVTDTDQEVKLGLRSHIRLANAFTFVLRAGAQATQSKLDETVSGVTTTTTSSFVYCPYAGAGLHIGLMNHVAFTAEVVSVFTNYKTRWTNNDYQVTAGLIVHFP